MKFFRLNSLRKKFILVITLLLFGVFIVDGTIAIFNSVKQTRQNVTAQAIAFAQLSTKPISEAYDLYFNSGYYKFYEVFTKNLKLDSHIKRIQLIDVNGKIIFDSNYLGSEVYKNHPEINVSSKYLDKVLSDQPSYIKNPNHPQEITEIFYPHYTDWGSHPYTLRYFVSYDQVRANIITIINQTLVLMLIFFIFSVGLITGFVNQFILAPITTLNRLTQKISQGNYDERIKVDTHDEIEQLAIATNRMARTMEQNIIDLKELDKLKDEFIDIAAHNLKIPLNHLKFNLEFLINNLKDKVSQKDFALLKDTHINYHKLHLLSEDLINVTLIGKKTLEGSLFMPLDLAAILNEVMKEVKPSLTSKKILIASHLLPSAPILGDYMKIKQVFLNLLDNAVNFSRSHDKITINIIEKSETYLTEIIDTGVGIDKSEMPKVFQKFYRAPSSAKYHEEGTGLGLYLAKTIIEVHHGKIWVESELGKGSKFSVELLKKDNFKQKYPFK